MLFSIGTQSFEILRNEGYTYVDKTALVYKLVKEGRVYFLGRPRRFGKSLLISTLEAYFEGKKELFEGLAIDKLEKDWKKYPVLHFDLSGGSYKTSVGLEDDLSSQLRDYEEVYGRDPLDKTLGVRFKSLIKAAARKTGQGVVVLVDEYDKPMLDSFDTPLQEANRTLLGDFYSALKGVDKLLRFVLLTGVTKFSQISVFSGFNQLEDISRNSDYEAICGITEDELYSMFPERIEMFAHKMGYSIEEMKEQLKIQYNGYHFSENLTDVYNPFSILNALKVLRMEDYWFSTATPEYLVRLMAHTQENIYDLAGQYYDTDMFANYRASANQPLPLIYQSGYLTIKDYDLDEDRYLLDIPNAEVRRGFISLIASGYFEKEEKDNRAVCNNLSNKLKSGRVDLFVNEMNAFLSGIPYDAHGGIENGKVTESHFNYTFFLIMSMVAGKNQVFAEKRSARGRADCVIEYKDCIYIFEFKLDGSAEQALKQIDEKGYAEPYSTDSRKVVKVGINFSSEKRVITEWLAEPAEF